MLNETRKQVRELRGPSRQHTAIQAYRYLFNFYSVLFTLILKFDHQKYTLDSHVITAI